MDIKSIKQRFGLIGENEKYLNALRTAHRVAVTDLTVLITGESGAGKEVFSKIIHHYSKRKHNKFIAVNCGAIPEGTIDSELFGHEKGAFTGASDTRKGYFETVNDGTIFLDEIGEMPLGTQARLLRVLETGEFIKVGSSKVQKTNVRVVGATNRSLMERIENGKFREDLYYRLSTVPINVPSLRERKEDIFVLFRKFASDFAEKYNASSVFLDETAQKVLESYTWPGNVRQLKNIAEQVSVLSKSKVLNAHELMEFIPEAKISKLPALLNHFGKGDNAEFSERDILYKVLFDMKKDLTELKSIIFEMVNSGQISSDKVAHLSPESLLPSTEQFFDNNESYSNNFQDVHQPQIVNDGKIVIDATNYNQEVEESLSIADKENELIQKALKKHKGKRKYAAADLGISERTLYRKIKEYQIKE